ncbi:MAG: GNAT family N-acetyltransferase [Bacteroidota bacterium]
MYERKQNHVIDSQIRKISASETLPIRHEAMWPDKPLNYIKLPNDALGLHYGLFLQDKLVSVISLFQEGSSAQFRKFATLTACQGKGYGTPLLRHIMEWAENEQLDKIWCNARIHKGSY